MSLLLLNASNRISQGLLSALYSSQSYDRILCADVYPNYGTIQRFLKFRESLDSVQSKTKLELVKISDRQDLHDVVQRANNLLYVSHDYYQLTPSKTNLFTTTIDLLKGKNYQNVVYVAPVEHDNQQEADQTTVWRQLDSDARKIVPDLVGFRSDITFGPNSTTFYQITQRIVNNRNIYFKPLGASPAPIFTNDLNQMVLKSLTTQAARGKAYIAQGQRHIDWNSIIALIEQSLGNNYKAQVNQSQLENILHPTSHNVLTQTLYDRSYQNLVQLISQYRVLESVGYESGATLLESKPVDIEEYFRTTKVNAHEIAPLPDLVDTVIG